MEENLKQLLLKDLCARLPYKVKASFKDVYNDYISIIEGVDIYNYIKDDSGMETEITDVKPYLIPLSSMTEEQIETYDSICAMSGFDMSEMDAAKLIDWFNKNHFDYRGLIEKSLALDATGLNIY